jgi:putative transcriptional regulator
MKHVDAREVRLSLKLTQAEFCSRFGIDLASLRSWEQGRHPPSGSARVLLMVIASAPEAVEQAVAHAS